jgi:hypothetical protein
MASDPIDTLLSDPELTRAWTEFSIEWDEIEHLLYLIFDALIEDEPGATTAVFFSQTSHAARRSMVLALASHVFRHRHGDLKKIKNVLSRISARSDTRHKLAHGLWHTIASRDGTQTIRSAASTNYFIREAYSKERLQRAARDMNDTRLAVSALASDLANAKSRHREHLSAAGVYKPIGL